MQVRFFSLPALFLLFCLNAAHATITIERANSAAVGLYEKFEAVYNLAGFTFDNPYDPAQIDVTVLFTSPSGKEWRQFGFFDNYKNVAEWKVRFSPNEIGEWSFMISATSPAFSDQSEEQTFTAVASAHHGWIKLSEENPRYMEYADGTSYYGVGMYDPWQNNVARFDNMKSFGANTFAIWNITYGGMVNGYGLIEEELGRYNQTKCGKIDTMIVVAEERDLNIMYCFWPHDLFSNTVWAHQWHINPYRFITDVVDVYSDPECWEYQKKQYRYLIARFAYSRAWGIWEIMNEINGTDGWEAGRHDEARDWVKKVHDYFKANDPWQHPTTASRSGGFTEYWPEMYELIDLPNIHVYETQGWEEKYLGNTLRSSMYNYAFAAARFWDNFDQPGIFGEAGADWVRFEVRSPEYEAHYHNAIWATLSNGLASTPYWWTYSDPIRNEERRHMLHLSKFVADINFVKDGKQRFEMTTKNFDLYGIKGDSSAFGWMRQVNGGDMSGQQFDLAGVLNPDVPVYAVSYFNTWTGQALGTRIRPNVNNTLRDVTPPAAAAYPDVAFKIRPAEGGETPAYIELSADSYRTVNIDTLTTVISCYLFDAQNRFCPQASASITFTLQGVGSLDAATVTAQNGAATIKFTPSTEPGEALIIATAPGLTPDTLKITVKDKVILDDFESYNSNSDLQNDWTTRSGHAELSLADDSGNGNYCLKVDYAIGTEYQYTAAVERTVAQNFTGGRFFTFWLQPDGSNREIEIRLYDNNRKYWTYAFALPGTDAGPMTIPLEDFVNRDPDLVLDLATLASVRMTFRKGDGEYGVGTVYFDDFKFPVDRPTAVEQTGDNPQPGQFALAQNYPNPFNMATTIVYSLPEPSHVELAFYNVSGQLIEKAVEKVEEAGQHTVAWEAPGMVSSGVYFYQLKAGDFVAMKKCLLIK